MQDNKIKQEIEDVELIIGKIMQVGVLIAGAVLIVGVVALLVQGDGGYAAGAHPSRPLAILAGVAAFKPYAIMMLGIFLLILTPVLRVVVSIYAFIKEHDKLYAWITTVVLVILVIAMLIGYFGK